jgi:hypothetical protein
VGLSTPWRSSGIGDFKVDPRSTVGESFSSQRTSRAGTATITMLIDFLDITAKFESRGLGLDA